jgi:maleylacetate reductase
VRTGLGLIAVPTTYSGSEATPVVGETRDGVKRTRRDPAAVADVVLYDPELTYGLPRTASVASGLNAMAHAAEALYAPDADEAVRARAARAVRALAGALPAIAREPRDVAARRAALHGAWDAGACLATAAMGLHHQLAHVLGGTFGLPHAPTHAVLLPHVLAYNLPAAEAARAALAGAFGGEDPIAAVRAIARAGGLPGGLAALGLTAEGAARAAAQAASDPYINPRPVTEPALRALLTAALDDPEQRRCTTPPNARR